MGECYIRECYIYIYDLICLGHRDIERAVSRTRFSRDNK